MNAYKCDACGNIFILPEYTREEIEDGGVYPRIPMEVWNYKFRGVGIKYDICGECRDKIIKFIKGIEPKNTVVAGEQKKW